MLLLHLLLLYGTVVEPRFGLVLADPGKLLAASGELLANPRKLLADPEELLADPKSIFHGMAVDAGLAGEQTEQTKL